MQAETEKTSSRVLEMIGLKGEVTKGRATPLPCSGYDAEGEVQQNHHPWSVHGVPFADLEQAYARLRTTLPANGWKVVSDGPDKSKAKTPTLVADSPDGEFSAEVRLMDREGRPGSASLINVTVVSLCYETAP